MTSKKEQVVQAVFDLVSNALAGVTVVRNQEFSDAVDPAGWVNVLDGDPGDPEITLSPLTYSYEHGIPLEFAAMAVDGLTKEQALDVLMSPVGRAVAADRTLGGLVDFLQVSAASTDNASADGTVVVRTGDVTVTASYSTPAPLG